MTITQLRYFLTLTEYMNFTYAAHRLFISQSTLSQHIAKLENELGSKLFIRKNVGLALTAEGKYLQNTASVLLKELDLLPQTLAEVHKISQEPVMPKEFSITIDSATFYMDKDTTAKFVSAVQALSALHPEININVTESSTNDMSQLLLDKKVDVALGGFHLPKSNRIVSKKFSSQQMNLVFPLPASAEDFVPTGNALAQHLDTLDIYTINFDEVHTLNAQKWLDKIGCHRKLKFIASPWMLNFDLYGAVDKIAT